MAVNVWALEKALRALVDCIEAGAVNQAQLGHIRTALTALGDPVPPCQHLNTVYAPTSPGGPEYLCCQDCGEDVTPQLVSV